MSQPGTSGTKRFVAAIAPGVALGGVALGLVAGFDRGMHPGSGPLINADGSGSTVAESPTDVSTSTAGSCSAAQAITGDSVMTRWGPVQVEATVAADGTVCSSQAVVYPDGDSESVSINRRALPIIEQQVVRQGVAFDGVTGATFTTEGYRQSLQSILDSQ